MLIMVISLPTKGTRFASLQIQPKLDSRTTKQSSSPMWGYNPITTLFYEGWLSFIQSPSKVIEITAKRTQKGERGSGVGGSN